MVSSFGHDLMKYDDNYSDVDMTVTMMVMVVVMINSFFRCFSDVKTAVRISIATGTTTRLDLEILTENSGSVC